MKIQWGKRKNAPFFVLLFLLTGGFVWPQNQHILVNHSCTDITKIPESAILGAKQNLHIAYGHTSHGSQLTDAMSALVGFMNGKGYPANLYAWNNGGTNGALDLHDTAMGGDVGYYPQWVDNTRTYLGPVNPATGRGSANPDVNVIIWSWCGQASSRTEATMLSTYLTPMSQLEAEYWGVKFVYMTGHLDGSGITGNLNIRNNQIRQYCQQNNKILYDFADIESYDPDGQLHYMPLLANDNCDYDSDGNGSRDRNWAIAWQNTHPLNTDWFNCSCAHSQPLNGNRKAYAAWWLWARLGGWDGSSGGDITQTLSLTAGWNWISFRVLPADRSLDSVFASIIGNVEQVKTQSQSALRVSGNWVGDLANLNGIQQGAMYKVRVSQNCTLTISGPQLAVTTPIALATGWNWIAYLPAQTRVFQTALQSILSQAQQVKSQGQSAIYSGGQWFGDLTQMDAGLGYVLSMTTVATLIYQNQ